MKNLDGLFEALRQPIYWETTLERMVNKKQPISLNLRMDIESLIHSERYLVVVEEITRGTYTWSVPEKMLIAKSGTDKKRVVYMYDEFDRFVMGVIYRAMNDYYNDLFYPNCFSYRKSVTTKTAVTYIAEMKQNSGLYGLKMDISAYFNSVSRSHLKKCIDEIFPVSPFKTLIESIFLDDSVTFRGESITEYKALVAGTALGSFFANYCLRELDKFFYDRGIIYARYSDDIIVLAETPDLINEYLELIHEHLLQYGLKINPSKYVHFSPKDSVEYLGLSLSDDGIDISRHSVKKMKKTIKRWVKKARKDIEMDGKDFERVARGVVNRLNWRIYKSYIEDETKFGWGFYVFRFIDKTDSLREIDFYLRDQLRYLKTGKHNKANVRALSDDDFRKLGVLSLVDMYFLFRTDIDYYKETIAVLK